MFHRKCSLAMVVAVASLAPVVFGDEWSDTLSAARTALSSIKYAAPEIDRLEKDPNNSYAYINLIELLYNQNHRDLALSLIALGQTRVTEPQRLVQARAAMARYELDLPAIEKFYRGQIDAALVSNRTPEPHRDLSVPTRFFRNAFFLTSCAMPWRNPTRLLFSTNLWNATLLTQISALH